MEAEDTVMSKEQINKVAFTNPLLVARKQADISFKMGYNQALKDIKDGKKSSKNGA